MYINDEIIHAACCFMSLHVTVYQTQHITACRSISHDKQYQDHHRCRASIDVHNHPVCSLEPDTEGLNKHAAHRGLGKT